MISAGRAGLDRRLRSGTSSALGSGRHRLRTAEGVREPYRAQLMSESAELGAAYTGLREQRGKSSHLAERASSAPGRSPDAVGSAIISLQAGDSTRQRLEHVCHGLGLAPAAAPSLVPEPVPGDGVMRAICRLQAAQLRDAQREFGGDIGQIVGALTAILRDAAALPATAVRCLAARRTVRRS